MEHRSNGINKGLRAAQSIDTMQAMMKWCFTYAATAARCGKRKSAKARNSEPKTEPKGCGCVNWFKPIWAMRSLFWQIRYTSMFACEKTLRLQKVLKILKSNPNDMELRRLCSRKIASAFVKASLAKSTSKWYKVLSSAFVDTLEILDSNTVKEVVSELRTGIVVKATTSSNEADWDRLVGSDYEVATAITVAVLTYPDGSGQELLDKLISGCPRARKPILVKVEEIVSSRYMDQHASLLLGLLGAMNIELFKADEQGIVIRLLSLMAQSSARADECQAAACIVARRFVCTATASNVVDVSLIDESVKAVVILLDSKAVRSFMIAALRQQLAPASFPRYVAGKILSAVGTALGKVLCGAGGDDVITAAREVVMKLAVDSALLVNVVTSAVSAMLGTTADAAWTPLVDLINDWIDVQGKDGTLTRWTRLKQEAMVSTVESSINTLLQAMLTAPNNDSMAAVLYFLLTSHTELPISALQQDGVSGLLTTLNKLERPSQELEKLRMVLEVVQRKMAQEETTNMMRDRTAPNQDELAANLQP